jgi:hypothetical protein
LVISVDPGDTTGIAYWKDNGEFIEKEMVDFEQLVDRLEALENVTAVVCEDYRLRQGKQMVQTGSRFVAVQALGALRAYAHRVGADFVLQQPNILTIAAMHSGVKQPSNHSLSHAVDAYNHGYYFFETKGLLSPKPL